MKQLEFDFFENIDCYNINNFIINSSNFNAYNYLTNPDNKDHFIFLSGEDKSGKTYLSLIWKQLVNARNIDFNTLNSLSFDDFIESINSIIEPFDYYILDDLPSNFNEEKLFYILNTILNNNSIILITSNFNIFKKKILLKDLQSRVKSGINLKIGKFCKETKYIYIAKLLSDNKLFLNEDIMKYLVRKLPNNYKDLYFKVEEIVDFSSSNKITLQNIKQLFKFF